MIGREEYADYCRRYNVVWKYLQSCSYEPTSVIDSLTELRGYSKDSAIWGTLESYGFVYVDVDTFSFKKLKSVDKGDLGITRKDGDFLLYDRFIFPVRDMLGNIIALIGWKQGSERKYVTTPSRLFSKGCMFFGMEQLSKTGLGKPYILVEGIFDSLSVRSLGLNCVAMMGISSTRYKQAMYSLFGKLLAIPDCDKEGRGVVLNDEWCLPGSGKYLKLVSSTIKDIDDLIKVCDPTDVKTLFKEAYAEQDRVVEVRI